MSKVSHTHTEPHAAVKCEYCGFLSVLRWCASLVLLREQVEGVRRPVWRRGGARQRPSASASIAAAIAPSGTRSGAPSEAAVYVVVAARRSAGGTFVRLLDSKGTERTQYKEVSQAHRVVTSIFVVLCVRRCALEAEF